MTQAPPGIGQVRLVRIEDEMRVSYVDYAMSVNVSRAIPDVRDGLKPVQRRILYAMSELNLAAGNPYKKCATVVGEVMGKLPPARRRADLRRAGAHGAGLRRCATRWSTARATSAASTTTRPPPCATPKARLTAIAGELLADIDKNTVDFHAELLTTACPSRRSCRRACPNLLINGASGIGVSLATNIPPHNLGEICDAVAALLDNPDVYDRRADEHRQGPGLPHRRHHLRPPGDQAGLRDGRGRIVDPRAQPTSRSRAPAGPRSSSRSCRTR